MQRKRKAIEMSNKEYQDAWQKKNVEKCREYRKKYRAKHPEVTKRYRKENAEKIREYQANWRANNPDKMHEIRSKSNKKFRMNHRERLQVFDANRPRRGRVKIGKISESEWTQLLETYKNTCPCCGKVGALEIDHIQPISRNGKNEISNIQPLCRDCNQKK